MNLVGPLSDRDSWRATECSIDKAMAVVGTRSAMLILREAFYGTTRFDDFAERVGMTPAVAARRLKALVDAGVMQRRPYREPGSRTRNEYHLTNRGRDLLPALLALQQWGNRHLQAHGPAVEVVDASGSPVRVVVTGPEGRELTPEELRVRPGPGGRAKAAGR
jgi:DNA-binding HxlR family transcriptional regulator